MDAAVHAHAAERIVEVRRIAGEENAAAAVAFGHPLVHRVERAMRDLVAPGLGMHALQPTLDRRIAKDVRFAFLCARRKHRAPYVAHPQKKEPLLRLGEVAHLRASRKYRET